MLGCILTISYAVCSQLLLYILLGCIRTLSYVVCLESSLQHSGMLYPNPIFCSLSWTFVQDTLNLCILSRYSSPLYIVTWPYLMLSVPRYHDLYQLYHDLMFCCQSWTFVVHCAWLYSDPMLCCLSWAFVVHCILTLSYVICLSLHCTSC